MRYFSPGHPLAPSAFHSSLYTPLLLLFPLSYFVSGHPRSLSSLISLPLLSLHTRYLFFRALLHRRKTTHSISLSFISLHPRYVSLLLLGTTTQYFNLHSLRHALLTLPFWGHHSLSQPFNPSRPSAFVCFPHRQISTVSDLCSSVNLSIHARR